MEIFQPLALDICLREVYKLLILVEVYEMKFDLSDVEFSRNDINGEIKIPKFLDSKLAYLMGIQIGDGFLKKMVRGTSTDYCIMYDGHGINEFKWYNLYLKKLLKDLFNKEVNVLISCRKSVQIRFRSKAIFIFLHQNCGILESPKTNIRIPKIIISSNQAIKRSFLRGLADTDFSLTFKKRIKKNYYPVIDFQTNCKSLHEDTKKLLVSLGFKIVYNYRKSHRYNKVHDSYYIQISGRDQLKKWMREIGFESPNHITRYLVWKKLGYLPVGTNIIQRNRILKNGPKMGPLRPRPEIC